MCSAPISPAPLTRRRLVVSGQVQGVGFRPFVFRQAEKFGLTGFTLNSPEGVVIEVQGDPAAVEGFLADFEPSLPPLARLTEKRVEAVDPVEGETGFIIRLSEGGQGHSVLISPDVATCPDCLRELQDPADPRHLYPFINCVNCGPRYSITRSIPYDRPATSMACFALCEACAKEYGDPRDRRFHAQPNACPACGPTVWLTDAAGRELARGGAALRELARRLVRGEVAAVKGLGGFHLCCDATSDAAVAELRRRKNRPGKPLAIMVPDLETLGRVADVSPAEAGVLTGRERPIVLVRMKQDAPLAAALSPDTDFLGAMLPYAPLQHVLFLRLREGLANAGSKSLPALVMTSGNFSGEPIALGNREALARLSAIADCFLLHDRDILIRVDDSVVRVNPELGAPQFLRRARGYTPAPVDLPMEMESDGPCVLGAGPELKTTLCLTKGRQAFVSQHIGDLQNLETLQFYREIRSHLEMILQVRPQAVVRDLHPDYLSTEEAREFATARNIPLFSLQHHFAHAWAIAAETRTVEPLVCLTLDGSGWGGDGTVWGGECLFLDPQTAEMRRLGALAPVPMPGGEAAAREPWRMALAYQRACGLGADAPGPWRSDPEFAQAEPVLLQMLERGVNSPLTTSCGRLFDAVAALTGLCFRHEYEGQAAMLLEKAQDLAETGRYPCPVLEHDGFLRPDSLALFAAAAEDVRRGAAPATVARRFHLGLVDGLAELALAAADSAGTRLVGLSGGVFLNLTLATELPRALTARGLTPLSHLQVPPGDGCVSLGQAAFGRRALALNLPVSPAS